MDANKSGILKPSRPELLPGLAFLLLGAGLLLAFWRMPRLDPFLHRYFFLLAAAFFTAAAGFLSAWSTRAAQARGPQARRRFQRANARKLPRPLDLARQGFDRAWNSLINIDWRGDWLPLAVLVVLCGLGLFAAVRGWRLPRTTPTPRLDEWIAGALVAAAFPILVVERHFSALKDQPFGGTLARLVRLLLLNLLVLTACCVIRLIGLTWAPMAENALFIFNGAVAAELVLRAASYIFVPLPPLMARTGHATSAIAGLIRLQKPSLSALNATISRQFGIDLGRSWAIAFIRRAALPVLVGMLIFSWLLTGVTALGTSQRAVYEALGQPRGVLHSGLNFHLPWPLGVLHLVDYGEVREIPIVFAAEDGTPPDLSEMNLAPAPIEGPPPPNADRLWDSSHPSEASYLVADLANGQQSFEVANIDVRIIYRVGLSDQAAQDVVYNISAPESMIRAVSGQMLARYFARYTIDDVLGQNREAFVRGFQTELQQRLTRLNTGLDVIAVVVEAIHPPPNAADAYQNVQAAGIQSSAQVSVAKGQAITTISNAQIQALQLRNASTATSEERVDLARSDAVLFNGDYQAYAAGGEAFLFERRLARLSDGLAGKPLVIVDHHIPPSQAPIIDTRSYGTASATAGATGLSVPPPAPAAPAGSLPSYSSNLNSNDAVSPPNTPLPADLGIWVPDDER